MVKQRTALVFLGGDCDVPDGFNGVGVICGRRLICAGVIRGAFRRGASALRRKSGLNARTP
jgi:hypothetical protein